MRHISRIPYPRLGHRKRVARYGGKLAATHPIVVRKSRASRRELKAPSLRALIAANDSICSDPYLDQCRGGEYAEKSRHP